MGVFNAWREAPCSAWQSHAFARGVRGHAPPRKFLKMVRFREYFAKILSKKLILKMVIFYIKITDNVLLRTISFRELSLKKIL